MRIIFLHIPKTAGQSVHQALIDSFGQDSICPTRVNEQLKTYSINELNRYQVFSGHLDWSLLDCVKGPKYIFTILREPMDRVLSFYFYLREKAAELSSEELEKPYNRGLKEALNSHPKSYFANQDPLFRQFINNHYDNFYTYYFAGRNYTSRSTLKDDLKITDERLLELAIDNISTLNVFTVNNMSEVFSTIQDLGGDKRNSSKNYSINTNDKLKASDRMRAFRDLGADNETIELINSFCTLDYKIWNLYNQNTQDN